MLDETPALGWSSCTWAPRHHETVASLHLVMGKMAVCEVARRHRQLPALTGPGLTTSRSKQQTKRWSKCSMDWTAFAVCRFTTWVYELVICEISTKSQATRGTDSHTHIKRVPADASSLSPGATATRRAATAAREQDPADLDVRATPGGCTNVAYAEP